MASQREAGDSIKHCGRGPNAKAETSSQQGLQANLVTFSCLIAYLLNACLPISSIALGDFGRRPQGSLPPDSINNPEPPNA